MVAGLSAAHEPLLFIRFTALARRDITIDCSFNLRRLRHYADRSTRGEVLIPRCAQRSDTVAIPELFAVEERSNGTGNQPGH
jgi:hypothetical protein